MGERAQRTRNKAPFSSLFFLLSESHIWIRKQLYLLSQTFDVDTAMSSNCEQMTALHETVTVTRRQLPLSVSLALRQSIPCAESGAALAALSALREGACGGKRFDCLRSRLAEQMNESCYLCSDAILFSALAGHKSRR